MNRRRFLFGSLGMTAMGIFGLPNVALGVVPNVSLQIPKELMDNPLLDFSGLPRYSRIKPEHIKPAMMFLFEEAKKPSKPSPISLISLGKISTFRLLQLMTKSTEHGRLFLICTRSPMITHCVKLIMRRAAW